MKICENHRLKRINFRIKTIFFCYFHIVFHYLSFQCTKLQTISFHFVSGHLFWYPLNVCSYGMACNRNCIENDRCQVAQLNVVHDSHTFVQSAHANDQQSVETLMASVWHHLLNYQTKAAAKRLQLKKSAKNKTILN